MLEQEHVRSDKPKYLGHWKINQLAVDWLAKHLTSPRTGHHRSWAEVARKNTEVLEVKI